MIFNAIIPLPYYAPLFFNIVLILVVIAALRLFTKGYVIQNPNKKEIASLILLCLTVLYMGLRPISGVYFGDMGRYAREFIAFANGAQADFERRDFLWDFLVKFFSYFMSVKMYFVACAVLYIYPMYKASKNWLGNDRYFLFLMLVASFSFWPYGTNGIRNGIATSLFILGLSLYKHKYWRNGLIIASYFIHGSMIIPIAAYVLSLYYKKTKYYLIGWLLCIPLSLAFGGAFESIVLSLGIGGDRIGYLTMEGFEDQFSSTGFRWDFLIYSAVAVFVGYYFIIKRKFDDKLYIQLFNIYVTANAFWILMIRATFSNRFAYLSWFLMAIIIFYPFFKQKFLKQQQKVLGYSVLVYFAFTYFMLTIL